MEGSSRQGENAASILSEREATSLTGRGILLVPTGIWLLFLRFCLETVWRICLLLGGVLITGRLRRTGRKQMAPIIGKAKAAVDISIAYLTGIRHLFHRPYTLRFPQQRYAVEKGYRGRHLLHLDRCTGCGICAWI